MMLTNDALLNCAVLFPLRSLEITIEILKLCTYTRTGLTILHFI